MSDEENIQANKDSADNKQSDADRKSLDTPDNSESESRINDELKKKSVSVSTSANTTADNKPEHMEIHHPAPAHHSKKLKDYLFEFLMLFLAVTAGFFMENRREHYVEHKREKQFAKQLLADLRSDSMLFEKRFRDYQSLQNGYDRLLYLLIHKKDASDKEVLEALLPVTFVYDLQVTTTTYNQMKSSGVLRYIEKSELTSNLQKYYDVLLPRCINLTETSRQYHLENINPFYLNHFRTQDIDLYEDTLINKSPVIIGRTTETDQNLANVMGGYRYLLKIQSITMNTPALNKIKELISLIKEEYHL